MKTIQLLLCLGLVALAIALVIGSAAQPTVAVSSDLTKNSNDQALKQISENNPDWAADYRKRLLEQRRMSEAWKGRWKDDMEKFKSDSAAIDLKLKEQEKENAALEAKIKQTLADAKAEVEREKREQAAKAAAAVIAPPPTPPKPGASIF